MDRTNAERRRRYIAKLKARAGADVRASISGPLEARIGDLETELANALAELAVVAALRRRISEVEQERDTAVAEQASMRKMLDDGHIAIAQATAILAAKGIVPPEGCKTVFHSVHPDRVTDKKMKVRYEEAFKRAFAKKAPPPRPAGLPRTWAEWAVWKDERKKAKAAAKKAAKANPPKTLSRSRS